MNVRRLRGRTAARKNVIHAQSRRHTWAAKVIGDLDRVDDRLLTFDRGRATQKAAFLGELFIANAWADPQGTLFPDFFQTDREGRRKGIVVIDVKDLP